MKAFVHLSAQAPLCKADGVFLAHLYWIELCGNFPSCVALLLHEAT